jgi:hypothetical protein
MAATLTTIMAQTAVPNLRAEVEHDVHPAVKSDLNAHLESGLKSSVETKNCKVRARARWKMLRNVVLNMEFPTVKFAEERIAGLKRNVPKLETDSSVRPDISSEWVLQLQDFWFGPSYLSKI